ncbi:MAG: hypothetical protein ACHP84_16960 [Caulobacterales bacterium]
MSAREYRRRLASERRALPIASVAGALGVLLTLAFAASQTSLGSQAIRAFVAVTALFLAFWLVAYLTVRATGLLRLERRLRVALRRYERDLVLWRGRAADEGRWRGLVDGFLRKHVCPGDRDYRDWAASAVGRVSAARVAAYAAAKAGEAQGSEAGAS